MKKNIKTVLLGVALIMVAYFTGRGIRSWITEDLTGFKNRDKKPMRRQ